MNLAGVDLNLLVVLDALLDERHVTRAALRVGLSQPAASNALRRLRGILQDDILVRDGRRMRLTEKAMQLQAPLRATLNDVRQILEEPAPLDVSADPLSVRIFASDGVSLLLLPGLRQRLAQAAPFAQVTVRWGDRAQSLNMLANEEVDFVIGHYEDVPTCFHRVLLYEEQLVIQARSDHPVFSGDLTLERFATYPRIMVSVEGRSYGYPDQATARLGVVTKSDIVVGHLLTGPLVTLGTDLLTITGERLARTLSAIPGLAWRPLPFHIDPLSIEMIWHEQSDRNLALRWFRDQIVAVAQSLDDQTDPAASHSVG